MGKYLILQLKRLLRILPPVLIVAAILFGCLAVMYDAVLSMNEDEGDVTKFKVGVVGTAGDAYLSMGMAAVESFDSSRFTIEFVEMEEAEAETAMRRGAISAFIVVPDGFLDLALRGEVIPLKYVCTVGTMGLVTMVKDELTQIIEVLLIEAQKGTYGAGNALHANGYNSSQVIGSISVAYVEFIFGRAKMYRVSELAMFDGLGMGGYILSGLCVVLFLLICLTFAPVMIRKDQALGRMLAAHRIPSLVQVVCDFLAYLLGLLGIAGVIILYLVFFGNAKIQWPMIFQGLLALFALGGMSFFMYEAVSDLVSGVLMQFFVVLMLSFVGGCLYPISFFPESVQKMAAYLPTGLARIQLADCLLGTTSAAHSGGLILYGFLFLCGAILIRKFKIAGVRG